MSVIFDGSNVKYGTFPNEALFHNSTAFSLVVWFKNQAGSTQQHLIGADQNAGGSTRYSGIYYRGNSGGVVAFTKSAIENHYNIGAPAASDWNVAIVSRPTGATAQTTPMALNATDTSASTLTNGSGDLVRFILGARRIAGGSTYTDLANAKIGGFAIYQRELTSGEIDQYQGGAHPDDVGGYTDYMVFSGTGTATTQASENGRTMTFTGSPAMDIDTPWLSFTVDTIDDPIEAGDSFNYTTSGFSSLTAITTDKSGVTVSGISGIDGTATLIGWADAALYPALPSSAQFTFTDGTNNATKNSNISAPAGYTKVPVTAPELVVGSTIGKAILAATGRTIAAGDIQYHTTYSNLVVTGTTGYSVTGAGTFDYWLWVSSGADAGKMFYYAVTITEGGAVVVTGGLTSSGLTSSGLTRVGLTSSGL